MPQDPVWFKSSYSGAPNNECVECARSEQSILIRDSKDPGRGLATFSVSAWRKFTTALHGTS
ncbi:DUF397 domain-containing protein [Streptomyces sp. NPDC088124]|uniref:DUF397 domain-containing protein n=1 Tax=Streptomyces sp. NPDC088124 TaxID=3154654 RepID=UPI003420F1EF